MSSLFTFFHSFQKKSFYSKTSSTSTLELPLNKEIKLFYPLYNLDLLVLGLSEGIVALYDFLQKKVVQTTKVFSSELTSIAFLSANNHLFVGGNDHKVVVFEFSQKRLVRKRDIFLKSTTKYLLEISPSVLLSVSPNCEMLWIDDRRLQEGGCIIVDYRRSSYSLLYLEDQGKILIAYSCDIISILDLSTRKWVHSKKVVLAGSIDNLQVPHHAQKSIPLMMKRIGRSNLFLKVDQDITQGYSKYVVSLWSIDKGVIRKRKKLVHSIPGVDPHVEVVKDMFLMCTSLNKKMVFFINIVTGKMVKCLRTDASFVKIIRNNGDQKGLGVYKLNGLYGYIMRIFDGLEWKLRDSPLNRPGKNAHGVIY